MQMVERHEKLLAELVVRHDHDVRIALDRAQQIGRRRLVQIELAAGERRHGDAVIRDVDQLDAIDIDDLAAGRLARPAPCAAHSPSNFS